MKFYVSAVSLYTVPKGINFLVFMSNIAYSGDLQRHIFGLSIMMGNSTFIDYPHHLACGGLFARMTQWLPSLSPTHNGTGNHLDTQDPYPKFSLCIMQQLPMQHANLSPG